jgi:hypothetical protein
MQHATIRTPSNAREPARTAPQASRSFQPARLLRDRGAAARVLQSVLASGGRAGAEDDCFDAAVALYEFEHWDRAYADLTVLADRGHARAAKLALLMLRYGAAVYGSAFVARPGQVARWAQRVLRAQLASRPA